MKIIKAGDAEIPGLGFGTWQLQGQACADRVADALGVGYRHLDTAQMYENHAQVGAGMRRSGVVRESIFLTTKLWFDSLHRAAVRRSTEESLRDLGTDYVDLLLIHWPNEEVPLQETLDAMLEQREKGRVRHIGVSNFPPSWLEEAADAAPVVCDQVEYHPLLSQDPVLGPIRGRGLALIAYSPLAHGELLEHPVLREIAGAHGRTPAQVALRWLIQQSQVGAIPKAASRDHLQQNFQIFDFNLGDDEMQRLHGLAKREGERTVDPDFAPRWER
jgi:2,5-diketo-D-gluconate reductase B